jgi:hypothetical protein
MSKENVVTFYEQHVLKNDSLKSQLGAAKSRDDFAKIAMEAGSKAGLSFTKDELGAVMEATEKKIGGGGQLSDDQLSGVTGGAGTVANPTAPTISVKTLPVVTKPVMISPGQLQADTVGCCW